MRDSTIRAFAGSIFRKALIEASDVELAYSLPTWVIPRGLIAPLVFNLRDQITRARFLDGHNLVPASCVVHRRDCLDRYGYWNDRLPHSADHDMWCRIITGRPGNANVGYLRDATSLHFRANWRTIETSEPRLKVWHRMHQRSGLLPDGLKVAIPDDMSEQEAVWNAVVVDPKRWLSNVRESVALALDRRVTNSDDLLLALLEVCESRGAEDYYLRALSNPDQFARAVEDGRLSRSGRAVGWFRELASATLRRWR